MKPKPNEPESSEKDDFTRQLMTVIHRVTDAHATPQNEWTDQHHLIWGTFQRLHRHCSKRACPQSHRPSYTKLNPTQEKEVDQAVREVKSALKGQW
jgi:hypothetical protein